MFQYVFAESTVGMGAAWSVNAVECLQLDHVSGILPHHDSMARLTTPAHSPTLSEVLG